MSIDPTQIELTSEQKKLIAERAERLGVDYSALLDELLGIPTEREFAANGSDPHDTPPQSMLEAMQAIGAWGCFEGPGDLSTNPKYMEGFGKHASRSPDSD